MRLRHQPAQAAQLARRQGFGGCIVALMPQAAVAAVRQAIAQAYLSPSGEPALVWVCTAQDGVKAMAPPLWPALPEA